MSRITYPDDLFDDPLADDPDDYEPGFEEVFVKLVDRLDPPTAT